MSRPSPILKAPDFPETEEVAAAVLLKQIDSIQAIKVLSRLTRAVQKHRGASIAYINGEARFLPLAESLQEQVQKLFYLLCDIENDFSLSPLTEETGSKALSVSPDGKYAYYFVDKTVTGGGELILKRVNLDGTDRRTIMVVDSPLPCAIPSHMSLAIVLPFESRILTLVGLP